MASLPRHADGRGCHAAAVAGAGTATARPACAGLLAAATPHGCELRRRGSRSLGPRRGPEPRQPLTPPDDRSGSLSWDSTRAAPTPPALPPRRIAQVATAASRSASGEARSRSAIAAARACRSSAASSSPRAAARRARPRSAAAPGPPASTTKSDSRTWRGRGVCDHFTQCARVGDRSPWPLEGSHPPLQQAPRRPGRP